MLTAICCVYCSEDIPPQVRPKWESSQLAGRVRREFQHVMLEATIWGAADTIGQPLEVLLATR